MTTRINLEGAGDSTRRSLLERRRRGTTAGQRRHQAEELARQAGRAARHGVRQPGRLIVILLAAFLIGGLVASLVIVTTMPPDVSRNQIAFLLASGCAVWGLVGLAVILIQHKAPARQATIVAYDALRQGLLIAGCLELNLATRMIDLWSPVTGVLLVAVFALFEVVTLGRRPA
ncbi:MAG: hypothetical protein ACR2JY_10235 [Chloroflexota bacterium]